MPSSLPRPITLWPRLLLVAGGLFGAAGVALAAVAAHITGGSLATGADFLLFHAAALVGLALFAIQLTRGRAPLLVGATAILLGTLLFSGDLTARALMEMKLFGGSAPFGGTLMIAGWLMVAFAALRARTTD
ncbi:hypothetical protein GCM10007301_25350 [Azorhizobium oxalatiphilum]|uniref:DUF423 domain-containing protein n=1 Tax=Azorhizobium oxalatiphilum TaxID=980631 RepID=A0A917C0H2_9HYPH|nr:DUF423 domain-containing protein [Azorhizobium oxalatiphilum]GGF64476.1 hypothetical protein GCM10007301_25350 [Azorhizobium oxalatiphilum]